MQKRNTLKLIAASALLACAGGAFAQDVIKIANIVELSGGGATAGTNFKNGVELAVKEINAAGGILGKKIQTTTSDTQTNPGVAKGLTQKAADDDVFAIFGPVFSGSIMVSMAESQRAEIPNFTGGEAASDHGAGQPLRVSHQLRPVDQLSQGGALHQHQGQDAGRDLREQRLRQGWARCDHQAARRQRRPRSSPTSRPMPVRSTFRPRCSRPSRAMPMRCSSIPTRRSRPAPCANCASRAGASRSSARPR